MLCALCVSVRIRISRKELKFLICFSFQWRSFARLYLFNGENRLSRNRRTERRRKKHTQIYEYIFPIAFTAAQSYIDPFMISFLDPSDSRKTISIFSTPALPLSLPLFPHEKWKRIIIWIAECGATPPVFCCLEMNISIYKNKPLTSLDFIIELNEPHSKPNIRKKIHIS